MVPYRCQKRRTLREGGPKGSRSRKRKKSGLKFVETRLRRNSPMKKESLKNRTTTYINEEITWKGASSDSRFFSTSSVERVIGKLIMSF